jgi:hypothetical protein
MGTWHLKHWKISYSDGRAPSFPFGEDATGLIQYTHDGGMAACIARALRPRLSGESTRSVPEAERLAAFESYFQYAGTYQVQDTSQGPVVVHRVSHALNPNFKGTEQVRHMRFPAEGQLELSADDPLPGSPGITRHHSLLWARAAA